MLYTDMQVKELLGGITKMIRTVIVHDVCLYNDLLAKALADEKDISVVGQAATAQEALDLLEGRSCDVVLVNLLLQEQGAAHLTKTLLRAGAQTKVVITGLVDSKTAALQCFEMGAACYVHQECSVRDLVEAVRCAARGEAIVSPDVAGMLVARIAELKRLATELNGYQEMDLEDQASELTNREREVLGLIGRGYTNQQIADELVIGVGTVKNHVHNILEKLDVHTRKQAAMIARQFAVSKDNGDDSGMYTWPQEMGIEVRSRREAASVFSETV
jgi:DNA-binding NarL/FixJ family response regulator